MSKTTFEKAAIAYKQNRNKAFRLLEKASDISHEVKVDFVHHKGWAINRQRHAFWKSHLAKSLVKAISLHPKSAEFVKGYSSQKRPYSFVQEITSYLLRTAPTLVYQTIKSSKNFLNEKLWSQLEEELKSTPELELEFMEEFRIVRREMEKAKKECKKLEERLKRYDMVEFLTLASIILEKERLEAKFIQQEDFQATSMFFRAVVSRMLRKKAQLGFRNPEINADDAYGISYAVLDKVMKSTSYFQNFKELFLAWRNLENMHEMVDMFALQGYRFYPPNQENKVFIPGSKKSEEVWERVGAKYEPMLDWYTHLHCPINKLPELLQKFTFFCKKFILTGQKMFTLL